MTAALPPVIAVDGPAASGKGTIAQAVARALGFHYLDSGSLYCLVALKALRAGIPLDDHARLAEAAARSKMAVAGERIELDGEDVTAALRSPAVSAAASEIAVYPEVRRALLSRQSARRHRDEGACADRAEAGQRRHRQPARRRLQRVARG